MSECPDPNRLLAQVKAIEWRRYGWAALVVAVCTLLTWVLHRFLHFELSNLVMLYLIGVVGVAARLGRGPAILASVAAVAAFDFFYVRPYYTFAVEESQYLVTFAVMLTVGIFISSLTVRTRQQAEEASLRERRTAQLYAMSRRLSSTRGMENLLATAAQHVSEVFECDVLGLLPDSTGRLVVRAGDETAFPLDGRERGVAQRVFELGKSASLSKDTAPSAEALYVPLNASRGPIGVLCLHPRRAGRVFGPEQMHLLEAFTNQAALAIECDRLAGEAQKAQVTADTEKSRNALLSSVSHDLRTPLATICGAASSLLDEPRKLNDATQRDLLETIYEEANRLARMVANLLEMTKLESGAATVKKEWCPLEEVIGSALTRLEKILKDHPVTTRIVEDMPLVPLDVILLEQVLVNLLENAAKYTPPGSPVEISATAGETEASVQVADRGPGLAPGDDKKVFEKFYRGESAGVLGTGLGLAICRAVIQAHGGRIWAENRPGGGAIFCFTLPLKGEHPPPPGLPVEVETADERGLFTI